MEVIEFIDSLFFRKATWIWLNFVCVRQIIYTKYLVVSKTSFTFTPRKGESVYTPKGYPGFESPSLRWKEL